jgi:hypothetical protein
MSDDTTAHVDPGSAGARKPSRARKATGAAGPTAASEPPGEQKPGDGSKPAEPNVPEPEKQPGKPDPAPPISPPDKPPAATPAPGDEEQEERDERRYLDRVDDEEQDFARRQQNLSEIEGEEVTARAGRDAIGGDSIQASEGGSIYKAGRDLKVSLLAGGDGAPQIRYLRRKDAEQLRRCLVAPSSQAELKDMLGHKTLVFLRGAAGTGRLTAALDALLTWASVPEDGETSHVGVIVGARPPFHRAVPDLRLAHGYVLEAADTWSGWDIGALAETMKDLADNSNCRVIILVSCGGSSLPAWVVDHRPPPAPEVFRCWLEHEAVSAKVDMHLLDEMRQEIDDDLRRETSPQQAVHLMSRLVTGLKAGRTTDELRAELPRQVRDGVRHRLDEGKPVLGRCFMTSAAVLNGLEETTVSGAALTLAERIKKISSIKPEEPLPAWEQLSTWLDYAGATTSPAQTAGGSRTVRLSKPRAEIVTLQVLWEDHPTIREPVVAWLKDLAEEAEERKDVQMKAAHAAGIIATFDFDIARTKFLDPWIHSRKLRDYRLAAMMLESAVARDPDILSLVLDLLRKLADGTRGERLVVAQAYGSPIGRDVLGIALRDLRKIAYGRDTEVSKAVAGSIGNLYSKETSDAILKELVAWVDSGSPGGLYTAALAFIRLARIGGGSTAYPPLIALESSNDLFVRLTVLWQNALSLRVTDYRTQRSDLAAPDSWTVLARWLGRYEEPLIQEVIRAVVTSAITIPRLRKAFILNLWQWERRKLISRDLRERLIAMMKGG